MTVVRMELPVHLLIHAVIHDLVAVLPLGPDLKPELVAMGLVGAGGAEVFGLLVDLELVAGDDAVGRIRTASAKAFTRLCTDLPFVGVLEVVQKGLWNLLRVQYALDVCDRRVHFGDESVVERRLVPGRSVACSFHLAVNSRLVVQSHCATERKRLALHRGCFCPLLSSHACVAEVLKNDYLVSAVIDAHRTLVDWVEYGCQLLCFSLGLLSCLFGFL